MIVLLDSLVPEGEKKMKIFTTGQVAKICGVSNRLVAKWFNSGRLMGYIIPGTRERRIPQEYLVKFLKKHGMPLGCLREDEDMFRVLLVTQDQPMVEGIKRELPVDFELKIANSSFDAGTQAITLCPHCAVVDFCIGRGEAINICQKLRENTQLLIILLPSCDSPSVFCSSNMELRKPFDPALLIEYFRIWREASA